jgi:hypothetical protein
MTPGDSLPTDPDALRALLLAERTHHAEELERLTATLGIRPPSIDQMDLKLPTFAGGPAPPRPRSAALPGAKQSRRPGWVTE